MTAETEIKKMSVAEFRELKFADDDPFTHELIDGDLSLLEETLPSAVPAGLVINVKA